MELNFTENKFFEKKNYVMPEGINFREIGWEKIMVFM
jgi:hypothetical protein